MRDQRAYTFTVPELDGIEIAGETRLHDDGRMEIELSIHDGAGKITVEWAEGDQVTKDVEAMTHELRPMLEELTAQAFGLFMEQAMDTFIKEVFG